MFVAVFIDSNEENKMKRLAAAFFTTYHYAKEHLISRTNLSIKIFG